MLQPADVGLFGPLKQAWYKTVRRFTQQNPNTDIAKKNFSLVFKSTWQDIMCPSILCDAFRKSGVYLLRREQITDDQTRSSLTYSLSSATVTGQLWSQIMAQDQCMYLKRACLHFKVTRQSSHSRNLTKCVLRCKSLPNIGRSHEFVTKRVLYSTLCPLPHVRVESTSFDEEPIPLLEDSRYSSQLIISLKLAASPSFAPKISGISHNNHT